MPDYSVWPEKMLRPQALLLDSQNPRIPPTNRSLSQRELITDLVAHDHVEELAKEIAAGGWVPVESLVGVDENGQSIVLEGNRRLAALKLLFDSTLAPEGKAGRFAKLAGVAAGSLPDKVRVLMAPSREAAAPLILSKHTRDHVERWSPLQQARFYRRLVDATGSPETAAKAYGVTPGTILEFLRLDAMFEIAQAMELPTELLDNVQDPRKFPASVLDRLLSAASFRDFLMLRFDGEGKVATRAKPTEFRGAYSRVLTDIASGQQNTRTLNNADEVDKYVKTLVAVAPTKSSRWYGKADIMGSPPPVAAEDPEPASDEPPSRRRATSIIPTSLRCTVANHRINEIFRELKRVSPRKYPNAHALLQRLLIELAVAHYLTKTRRMAPLEKRIKQEKRGDVSPTLTEMLRELLADPALANMQNRIQYKKAIEKLLTKKGLTSVETMNAFFHTDLEWPDEREIRRLWHVMEPILQLVLREPEVQK